MVGSSVFAADIIALDSQRTVGNQGWLESLGMDFDVGAAGITVTQLGAFDSSQDGFSGTIMVGIFDRSSAALVGVSASLTGTAQTLVGNQRFFDIADFNLAAGNYSIVAVGFSNADQNGNNNFGPPTPTINTGGLLSFVGSARYQNTGSFALVFPTTADAGPANRYDAGTFMFTSVVPEPSGYALALAAMGVLGGSAMRRKVSGR